MSAAYLNVELEIESRSNLDSFLLQMGKRVVVLHSGPGKGRKHFVSLESSQQHKNPDAAIYALCSVIEGLPPAARQVWDRASKTFGVGYELRPSERNSQFPLRPDTLELLARLGAALAVTYYRGEE